MNEHHRPLKRNHLHPRHLFLISRQLILLDFSLGGKDMTILG